MFHNKPIIGIVGGIGSGKSFVADLFGQLGCLVIKADDLVHQVYRDPEVLQTLRAWWGNAILQPDGSLNRSEVARRVFDRPDERRRLEALVHPRIAPLRDHIMRAAAHDPRVLAFVWDTPLLFEVGLDRGCDSIVFVQAPEDLRARRVKQRGWEASELLRREKVQLALDKKRALAHYVVENTADAAFARRQVEEVLSRILRPT